MSKQVIIMRGISGSGKSTAILDTLKVTSQASQVLRGNIWYPSDDSRESDGIMLYTESNHADMNAEDPLVRVVSADYFFHVNGGGRYGEPLFSGMYYFEASKLGEAHAICFNTYVESLMSEIPDIVYVDNTNCNLWEISPYIQTAHKFGWNVKIIEILCDIEEAHERSIHQVPLNSVQAQEKALHFNQIPPFWANITVEKRLAKSKIRKTPEQEGIRHA